MPEGESFYLFIYLLLLSIQPKKKKKRGSGGLLVYTADLNKENNLMSKLGVPHLHVIVIIYMNTASSIRSTVHTVSSILSDTSNLYPSILSR